MDIVGTGCDFLPVEMNKTFTLALQGIQPLGVQFFFSHVACAAKPRNSEEASTHARHQVGSIVQPGEMEFPIKHHLNLRSEIFRSQL